MTTGLSPLVQDRLWLPPALSDKSLLAVITLPRNKLLSFVEIDSANSFIDEATSCFFLHPIGAFAAIQNHLILLSAVVVRGSDQTSNSGSINRDFSSH